MAPNNFQLSYERTQPKRLGHKLGLDAVSMLSSKVDAMYQKLKRLNVNSISSSTPSPSCDIRRSVYHWTVYGQVSSLSTQDASDQVNYVNNYNP